MFDIPVQEIREGKGIPPLWLEKLLKFTEQVRHKAFELFAQGSHGHDVNEWLEAEKQIPSAPRYEVLESADDIDVSVALPGFDADEIGIVALRDSLLVRAASRAASQHQEGDCSEFDDQALFRRIRLPAEIDVTRVRANLDRGVLSIAAHKAAKGGDEACKATCATCRARQGASLC
jgi:HSP20 family molecular chaperone IbpA